MKVRSHWETLALTEMSRLRDSHLARSRRVIQPLDAVHALWQGRRVVNFCSNNYLGLTHHSRILDAARSAVEREGFGSAAAPLITGYGPAHAACEEAIAKWKGAQSAVLLPSGYQANHAAIQTIAAIGRLAGGVRFLVDKLAHASLIDAIRATGEPFRVYPHHRMAKLRRLLEQSTDEALQVVVTESIFSMDGDAADLREIAALKRAHPFLLLVDEAHASGVYGPAGAGLAAELELRDAVDVSVITLSKALGGIGGAVCGSEVFREMLINHARAYLFSTAPPASTAAAAQAAIEVLREEPCRQQRVRALARQVRQALADTRLAIPRGDSPIIPIIVGEEEAALKAADQLLERGLLTVAVRPPTVAKGASRLRITLSSEHNDEEVRQLLDAIRELRN